MWLRAFLFCVVLSLAISFTHASAATFAGGTGEPNDPYQIATAEQLMAMSTDQLLCDKSFILTADIDLDPRLPGSKVFSGAVLQWTVTVTYLRSPDDTYAILGSPLAFEGCFDGNGHFIRNCMIYSIRNAGFFLAIGAKGTVRNLHLQNIFVGGTSSDLLRQGNVTFSTPSDYYLTDPNALYHGALAAVNSGTIDNCSATGTILADGYESGAGGLVGQNTGTLNNCSAECQIQAYYGGGLVGQNTGTLNNCSAGGQVTAYYAAGLVAVNDSSAQVISCTSNGFVYGPCGSGLVGENSGNIQRCKTEGYVLGEVVAGMAVTNTGTIRESHAAATLQPSTTPQESAAAHSGHLLSAGLVLGNGTLSPMLSGTAGTVVNCYSTSTFTINKLGGHFALGDGLIGVDYCGTVLTSWSTLPCLTQDYSLSSGSSDFNPATVRHIYYLDPTASQGQTYDPNTYGYGVPLSPDEMKHKTSFIGWDFDTVWTIHEGQDYPRLKWEEPADAK